MFELDRFIDDCKKAAAADGAHKAITELVTRCIEKPEDVTKALGEPERAGVNKLYQSDSLTILNLVWGPDMYLQPHNHEMEAVIGIYTGVEENYFFKRTEDGLAQHGSRPVILEKGNVAPLGFDIIHAVKNPLSKLTGALHVYTGDFFETPRSEWDPETLEERVYSVEGTMKAFEDSNRRLDELNS